MSKIDSMRAAMVAAGFYKLADIEEICKLEEQYMNECAEISRQCEEEGFPGTGDNYEIRCAAARQWYDEQIEAIDQKYEEENKMTREQELAEEIRSSQEWDLDQLKELCELAGMSEEWESADGETFEQVAFKAAEKLGVEIM